MISLTEFCLLVMILLMAVIAVCLIILATRLLPLIHEIQETSRSISIAARRIDSAGGEVEKGVQELRKTQTRLNGVVSLALDQVEPPLLQAAAIMTGVRAGINALFRSRK